MQKYNSVTVLKLPDCQINAYGIMLIANMLTTIGCIRDLDLDMNPNPQENYHLLCTPAGNLWYLSLNLCKISDTGIRKIMHELRHRDAPNDPQLIILSIANNHVTTDGAACISEVLRTNRSLRCLVLLGNRISDEGASMILQELKISTLTHEEIMDLRRRKFAVLTLMDQLMEKEKDRETDMSISEELSKKSSKSRTRHSITRRSKKSQPDFSIQTREDRSSYRTSHSIQKKDISMDGGKSHPFQNESYPINGMIFTTGNLALQYLDLSYNHITSATLRESVSCLYYQNYILRKNKTKGLIHLLIEGKSIEQGSKQDWLKFEELLQMRREGKSFTDHTFREFVSDESQILRENVRIQ